MIVSHIRGLLFFAFMNICESEIVAANRGPENPEKKPACRAAPTKFGSASSGPPARQRPGEALPEGEI